MTEEEAHYYLEKRAMDEGLSKKEVAAAVIRLYS
jgi:AmiR/NasT family two-component response regulator